MMDDTYIYVITALLPLAGSMVVVQKNPYHALVIRGILGAVAALVYAVLGAADVALTEALVGTMLAITLYAVAVRSSLNMRLGVLKDDLARLEGADLPGDGPAQAQSQSLVALLGHLRAMLKQRHMRLELVPYKDRTCLQQALVDRDIHALCLPPEPPRPDGAQNAAQNVSQDETNSADTPAAALPSYGITTRIRRLYDLMQAELPVLAASLTYFSSAAQPPAPVSLPKTTLSTAEEVHS